MTLTTRQKLLIPVLIIILAFLAWEIFSTVKESNFMGVASQPSAVLQKPDVPAAPKAMPFNQMETAEAAKPAKLNPEQLAYVELISRYKRLQMEKLIADNSQAIAQAKLKTAEADQKLAGISGKALNLPMQATAEPRAIYKLVYTGKLQGHWTATLRRGSELIDISVGNRLADGSTVVAINGSEVVLSNGVSHQTIGFNGLIQSVAHGKKSEKSTPPQLAETKPPKIEKKKSVSANVLSKVETELMKNNSQKTKVKSTASSEFKTKLLTEHSKPAMINTAENYPLHNKTHAKTKSAPSALDRLAVAPKFQKIATHKTKQIQKKVKTTKPLVKHTIKAVPQKVKITTKYQESEKDILALNPNTYTVQLAASYEHSYITRFITLNNLVGRSYQFQTQYKNKPWYALVYGEYKDISKAVAAIQAMPVSMRTQQPFVRKVGVIQKEIRQQHIA